MREQLVRIMYAVQMAAGRLIACAALAGTLLLHCCDMQASPRADFGRCNFTPSRGRCCALAAAGLRARRGSSRCRSRWHSCPASPARPEPAGTPARCAPSASAWPGSSKSAAPAAERAGNMANPPCTQASRRQRHPGLAIGRSGIILWLSHSAACPTVARITDAHMHEHEHDCRTSVSAASPCTGTAIGLRPPADRCTPMAWLGCIQRRLTCRGTACCRMR